VKDSLTKISAPIPGELTLGELRLLLELKYIRITRIREDMRLEYEMTLAGREVAALEKGRLN
jgi:hypothetical protein